MITNGHETCNLYFEGVWDHKRHLDVKASYRQNMESRAIYRQMLQLEGHKVQMNSLFCR